MNIGYANFTSTFGSRQHEQAMQRSRVFFLAWACLERNTTLPWRYSSYHTLWRVSSITHKLNQFVGSKSLNRHRGTKQRASKQVRAAFNFHGHYCNHLGCCDDVHRICPQLCWPLCGKGLPGTFRVRVRFGLWRLTLCPLSSRLIKLLCQGWVLPRCNLDHLKMVFTW